MGEDGVEKVRESRLRSVWLGRKAGIRMWAGRGSLAVLDQGMQSGANFFLNIALARWMGAAEYGVFAVALAIQIFLSSAYQALALIPMMITAPQLEERERSGYLEGLHRLLRRLSGGLLLLAGGLWVLQQAVPGWNLGPAIASAVALPAILFHWQGRDFHYLLLSPRSSAQAAALYAVIVIGGAMALRAWEQVSIEGSFLVMGLGAAAAAAWLHRTMPFSLASAEGTWEIKRTLRHSWKIGRWEFFASLASSLPGQAIYPAVAGILGIAQAGVLKALLNLATPLNQILAAIYRLGQPYLSGRLNATAERGEARRSVGMLALLGTAVGVVYLGFACAFGPPLLGMLYGEGKFEASSPLLGWAIAPAVLWGIAVAFSLGLRAINRFPVVLAMCAAGAAVFSAAVLPLSQQFGLGGTIAATLAGNVVNVAWAVVAFYLATKQMRSFDKGSESSNIQAEMTREEPLNMSNELQTKPENPPKQNIVGVEISKTSYEGVVECCRHWIASREKAAPARYITVTSVHGIVSARHDQEFLRILNQAAIATPDGMPVVWAMRSFGNSGQQRVYGPTLMLKLCEDAARHGHKIYLYGSTDECLRRLRENLVSRFTDLQIVGTYSPPFRALTPEEDADVVGRIQASGADLVFVGISTPKQEKWMAGHVELLPGVIMLGVGAAFDFHAGLIRQAPSWMQKRGLEWFFRLCTEPKRLWKRYVLETPRFLPLWAMQRLGLMRF